MSAYGCLTDDFNCWNWTANIPSPQVCPNQSYPILMTSNPNLQIVDQILIFSCLSLTENPYQVHQQICSSHLQKYPNSAHLHRTHWCHPGQSQHRCSHHYLAGVLASALALLCFALIAEVNLKKKNWNLKKKFFLLHWVFIAAHGPSLAVVSKSYSPVAMHVLLITMASCHRVWPQ